jgi:hypothetical protein
MLVEYPNSKLNSNWQWPVIVFGFIALLIITISVRNFLHKRRMERLDFWLFTLSGLAGLIIGWFTLYSEHPAMSPNYNLLWAFPPNLIFAFVWRVRKWRKLTRFYLVLSVALILLSFLSGQQFNPVVYLIIASLLVRIGINLIPEKQS